MKNKKIIIISLFLVIMLVFVLILMWPKDYYKAIEDKLVKNAKKYFENNKIEVENQEYLFASDLNIENGLELCSKASGVMITNVNGSIKYYPYLRCIGYESKIYNNDNSYIKLKGEDVTLVNYGTLYSDAGYEKIDDVDVEIVGEIPNEEGAYTINYVVSKNEKQKKIIKRVVIISKVDPELPNINLKDDEPFIMLKGEKEVLIKLNQKYEEPGYIAYDKKDGIITSNVVVEPKEIKTDKVGTQTIKYTVTNKAKKSIVTTRVLKVTDKMSDLKIDISTLENGAATNESTIHLVAAGNDFKEVILPNGETIETTILDYKVNENGTYTFKVLDKYDNVFTKSIIINNIDKTAPKGTCSVEKSKDKYVIRIFAEDDRGIASVNYLIDGRETGFFASTVYRTKEAVENASAIIQDISGNRTKVSCSSK